MGSVFLAHDPQLQRLVALKVPKREHISTEVGKTRFLREARAAAALHHRHLCPVYDVGEVGEKCRRAVGLGAGAPALSVRGV